MRDCSTCCLSLQLILATKGGEVQLKQLPGALCTGPVAPGVAEMHSSPVDVVLKHFLLCVPFFISSILTYATIIFLCNKAHWNFSSLPSLNNQQVVVAQTSNLSPVGGSGGCSFQLHVELPCFHFMDSYNWRGLWSLCQDLHGVEYGRKTNYFQVI